MTRDHLPGAADAGRLTEVLRRSGAVDGARVCNVAVMRSIEKQRSLTLRLHLDYEGPADEAPSSLILKMGGYDDGGRPLYANEREVAFYRYIAPALPARVVPHCFEAVDVTDTTAWHLLLEDLTDSHFQAAAWPLPPTLKECERIVRAWARFHAVCWNDPRLGAFVGKASWWERRLRGFAKRFERFTDRHGELLPREQRQLYERFIERLPDLLARTFTRRNLTLTHGDAHWANCLLPHHGDGEELRIIDWEFWHIDVAAMDLAYMLAMQWYRDRRRRIERLLLDRYHAELLNQGVRGYDRQSLDDDYRLSVLWLITRPVEQASLNIPRAVWWNKLERIMLAVNDLGCRDLLA
jgi:thiamine kinase-like enzyme